MSSGDKITGPGPLEEARPAPPVRDLAAELAELQHAHALLVERVTVLDGQVRELQHQVRR